MARKMEANEQFESLLAEQAQTLAIMKTQIERIQKLTKFATALFEQMHSIQVVKENEDILHIQQN
jgi:hypothetical protein